MEDYKKLYLYYPNNWRQSIKYLITPQKGGSNTNNDEISYNDLSLNWFMFVKKYYDSNLKEYISIIPVGSKFFEMETGKSYQNNENLLLINSKIPKDIKIPKELHIDGYIFQDECNEDPSLNSCVCYELILHVKNNKKLTTKTDKCGIISYSKRKNICIRKVIKEFPTPEEIDDALKKYKCNVVCKILHEYIKKYLSYK